MRKLSMPAVMTLTLFVLSGCTVNLSNGDSQPGLESNQVACDSSYRTEADGVWIDPGTTSSDCAGVRTVFNGLKSAAISAPPGSQFEKVFQGTDSQAVMNYLDSRVHYVVPSYVRFTMIVDSRRVELDPGTGGVVASNMGVSMFLYKRKLINYPDLTFELGTTPLKSFIPASGFIYLGENFHNFTMMQKMGTMVHEARHSDCESETSELCGLPHAECPTGHPYAGVYACDNAAIGPYFIGATYEKVLGESCSNCSESERQASRMAAVDSLSRVLNLDEIMSGRISSFNINTLPGFQAKAHRQELSSVHASRRASP